jgi:hypothetical protein
MFLDGTEMIFRNTPTADHGDLDFTILDCAEHDFLGILVGLHLKKYFSVHGILRGGGGSAFLVFRFWFFE